MNRQMRRVQAKQGGKSNGQGVPSLTELMKLLPAFQETAQAAKGVEPLVDKLKEVQGLVDELTRLRDEFKATVNQEAPYKVELERQRAVFLRFLFNPDIIMTSGQNSLERFLVAEQRYRNEYDAMLFLVRLLTWVKEAQ